MPTDIKHFAFILAGVGVLVLSVWPPVASVASELLAVGGGLIGWGGLKRPGDVTPEKP